MSGARLVVVEVRLKRSGDGLFWDEVVQHEHVRLLDDLSCLDSLAPKQHVGRDRAPGCLVLDQKRFKAKEALELLVDLCGRGVTVDESIRKIEPSFDLVALHFPVVDCRPSRPPQVPPRHHVCERVVIDLFVILVGPDDAVDVSAPFVVEPDP